ncbi:TonB-dependent receptor plug domain-containing protein [Sphingobium xenophagum]|uniref:TonB-dependent receptor plug domain-containing protein n=1 Tax=Sphingobium xenophagum TaxID=121428 RepID=UPI0020CE593C|nr:TonB-dependent receptor [Sphingobium xenophagum]
MSCIVTQAAHAQAITAADSQATDERPLPQKAKPAEPSAVDIVVTGTRVSRAGFDAPTPLTVIGREMLETRAPSILVDALVTIPAFRNTSTSTTASQQASGTGGQSFVNLRGLGPNRTLTLLNGQRYVPTTALGTVDISVLPSALVSRIDVVTGGASAAYGSDAVAGVVNFVLDTQLQGLRANAEAGISTRGDAGTHKLSLAWGGALNETLRVVAAAEYYQADGVDPQSRDFTGLFTGTVANPSFTSTNGQSPLLLRPYVYFQGSSYNGVVTSGPFRGTEFLPNGQTRAYDLCGTTAVVACPVQRPDMGGTFNYTALASPQERGSAYARISFQPVPAVKLFGDAQYAESRSSFTSVPYLTAAYGAITIRRDNAFLPASFAAKLDDPDGNPATNDAISSFTLGRYFADNGPSRYSRRTRVHRFSGGFEADVGENWKVNGYIAHGEVRFLSKAGNQPIRSKFNNSIDAVLVGGVPTCRVNADSVAGNDDAACRPANLFGFGATSAEAKDYYLGTAQVDLSSAQTAAAVNINGEPFSTWAGPVSFAIGAEYRHDRVAQGVDAVTASTGFILNNPGGNFQGSQSVKEGYAELVVPLADGLPFADKLELNGSARLTDYSLSGSVTTWKAGLTYSPVPDIRLRGTLSRDIRAPNLFELFSSGVQQLQTVRDPRTGLVTPFAGFLGIGNRDLVAEKAKTTALGVVLRPRFLPGFDASLDYYRIKIKDAIGTLGALDIITQCLAGNSALCGLVTRTTGDGSTTGPLVRIDVPGLNLQTLDVSGYDLEVGYRARVGPGTVVLRGLGNYLRRYRIRDFRSTVDRAGDLSLGLARWNFDLSAGYSLPSTTMLVSATRIGSGAFSTTNIVDVGSISGVWYLNAALEQKITFGLGTFSIYANINNILDEAPPFGFENTGGNYDRIGRSLKIGVRVKM